ncbi:MAG: Farnesyl-diphosphate farnesyltransferase, partial [Verrucomicrobiales bacterium]|nr:Farnesyl-diphosphate farnesyltransferase [Verrucomicrobiales bacterium]
AVTPKVRHYLLTALLKEVSRSFYLTLRILPGGVRSQIGLAYLLARASDTIADTEVLPVDVRLGALHDFRSALLASDSNLILSNFLDKQGTVAERTLLSRAPQAIALVDSFDSADGSRIRALLETIIGGQELDLLRFAGAGSGQIKSLQADDELDDYTYRVAGCVGEFWTHMCLAHLHGAVADQPRLIENGIRFGKGLQLVNILRDLPADLRNGRCYMPQSELAKINLTASDLLQIDRESQFRPLYNRYLERAAAHLDAGWQYTLSLPRNWRRVRLACSWPILIGLATLEKLRQSEILHGTRRIKISRRDVRNILLRSIVLYPFKKRWMALGPATRVP